MTIRLAMLLLLALMGRAWSSADSAVQVALARHLDQDRYWLDLVQYRRGIFGGYTRSVTSSTFFLDTSAGPRSPRKELEATIRAFYESVPEHPEKHAACTFPARRNWLLEQGVLNDSDLPQPYCKSLEQWFQPGMYQSVSIVFATGYLKNPASYFGHLFLKFNNYPVRSDRNLMNRAVNYGADVSAHDNPVVYALKGLTGGYVAFYSQNDFYEQTSHYGSNQLRDLWEYELELSPHDVQMISLRIWELFGESFHYYFFNENCAYFIVDPIEKELGVTLLPGYLPYSLPKHGVEGITNVRTRDGRPLVRDINFIPSKQSVFYQKHRELSVQEKRIFLHLISAPEWPFADSVYATLPEKTKKKLLDVLMEYNAYIHAGEGRTDEEERKHRELLLERLRLEPFREGDHVFRPLASRSPSDAPPTTMIGASGVYRSGRSGEFVLRVRPANHDLLSSNVGRAPNSALQVFDLSLGASGDGVRIANFDLLNIQALNTSTTGLPGDGSFSWSVRFGYGEDRIGCEDCDVYRGEGQVGYALGNTGNPVIPYALAGGRIQSIRETSGVASLRGRIGVISNRSGPLALRAEGGIGVPLDGARDPSPYLDGEARIALWRRGDMRVSLGWEETLVASLAYFSYW